MSLFNKEGPVNSLIYQYSILKTYAGPQKVYPSSTTQTNRPLVLFIYLLCFALSMDTKGVFPNSSFKTEAKVFNF